MSVSLACTTMQSAVLFMQCRTILVSASSWCASSADLSMSVLVDPTHSSCSNPPAVTTILLSSADSVKSSDSSLAKSALFSGSAKKFLQSFGRGTLRFSITLRTGLVPFDRCFLVPDLMEMSLYLSNNTSTRSYEHAARMTVALNELDKSPNVAMPCGLPIAAKKPCHRS